MHRRPTRYALLTLAITAAAVAAVGAFTYAVDPYAIHGQPRVTGFNAKKPYAYTHATRAKRALASAARPRLLLLGNSRMDIGFDPESPLLPEPDRPAFNFGIPGQALASDYRNLIATPGLDRVQHLVIGLDFQDFAFDGNDRPQARPSTGGTPSPLDLMRTNFSTTALVDATLSVLRQDSPYTNSMTALGASTAAKHAGFVRLEGHHALFHQRNLENLRAYLRRPRQVQSPDGRLAPSFVYLDWILEWARAREVRVDFLIYPYHAQLLELLHHTGHWAAYEHWKRLLVRRVEHAGGQVRLWDFSGYHEMVAEPVPAPGDTRTRMQWYWEAGHFKSTLGDLMLARMLDGRAEPAIGVRLHPGNIEQIIARIHEQRRQWRAMRPDEARYVESLYRAARP